MHEFLRECTNTRTVSFNDGTIKFAHPYTQDLLGSLNLRTEETEEQALAAGGSSASVQDSSTINIEALTEQIMKRLNAQLALRNLAGLEQNQQDDDDSSQDLDLDFNERRVGKEKGWRAKMEKDPDKVIKHVIKSSRGGNLIEKMMIEGFNNDINVSNIYKNGNIEVRVPNLLPMLARGVMNYVKKKIDNEEEKQRFVKGLDAFHDSFVVDCVGFIPDECLDLLKKVLVDVREERDKLDVGKNYLELRREYLNTQRKIWRRRNTFNVKGNSYGGGPRRTERKSGGNGNTKKLCLDWNKKGKCTYPNCRYVHECSNCGSTQHGSVHCKENNEE